MLQDMSANKSLQNLNSSADLFKQDLLFCMEMLRHDSAGDSECETSEDSSL